MKRRHFLKTLSAWIICSSILLSCQKEESIKNNTDLSTNKTDVTLSLVKKISGQFSFNTQPMYRSKGMKSQSSVLNTKEQREIKNIEIIKDNNNEPAAYIVNYKPNGFVIISGTKKEEPILAYSSESTFNSNELSQGVANWVDKRLNKIEQLKNSNSNNVPLAIQKEWNTYSDNEGRHGRGHENDELDYIRLKEPDDDDNGGGGYSYEDQFFKTISEVQTVGPLLKSKWGQRKGYNESLPLNNNGKRADAGCVAIAAAQVMNYYKWPKTYNWDIFSNRMRENSNSEAKLEISKLMRDIGESIGMKYSTHGSEACAEKLCNSLINRFKYSKGIKYINYNHATVVSEIRAKHPVIMRGDATKIYHGWWLTRHAIYKNGHTWVCDGYKAKYTWNIDTRKTIKGQKTKNRASISSEFLHMNWGWNGSGLSKANNGWYKFDDFTVKLSYTQIYNFKYKQHCIINIRPNK